MIKKSKLLGEDNFLNVILIILIIFTSIYLSHNLYKKEHLHIKVIRKPPSNITDTAYDYEEYKTGGYVKDEVYKFSTVENYIMNNNINNLYEIIKLCRSDKNKMFIDNKYFIAHVQESVTESSDKWNVPKSIIYAVINQESDFNPYSLSNKQCYGLMQINYNVWKDQFKIKYPEELYDISFNISCGTRLLKHYYEKYGDWENALKGYFGISRYSCIYSSDVMKLVKKYKKIT